MTTKQRARTRPRIEDLPPDQRLTLAEAARIVPGGPVAPSALARWRREGLLGRDGEVLRLKCCRLGGRKLGTTPANLLAFFDGLEATKGGVA